MLSPFSSPKNGQFLRRFSPMDALPAELILVILAHISSPEDILNCKLVSRKFHRLIAANAVKLARPLSDCAIKQIEKCWEIEISRNGQKKKWQIEQKKKEKKKQQVVIWNSAVAFRPFWHFEFATIALIGPFSADGISLLIGQLKLSGQTKIRSVFMENFHFENVQIIQKLFCQLMRQKCERIHLRNCRFNSHFVHFSLLSDHSLYSLHLLAQFRFEDENYESENEPRKENAECLPAHFLLSSMSKFARDVGLHSLRPHFPPFLWDSFVPLASSSDHSPTVSDQFLSVLATFVLNWQNHPSPPSFHFRLRRIPPHFATDFCTFCDRLAISHFNLLFPSLFRHFLRIQCKQNEEKRLFEMFSLSEMKSHPTVFCLISQQNLLINDRDDQF